MMMSFLNVGRNATPGKACNTLLTSLPAPGKRSISAAFNVRNETGDSGFFLNAEAFTFTSFCSLNKGSKVKFNSTFRV